MPVGVIVPVHGEAPWLARALDAVLSQDPAPAAVVVVDDGSTPPLALTADHAAGCALLRRERRGGPGPARATGLDALDADLVAFADADDVWHPGKLAAQLEALERHPEGVACFGSVRVVGPDGAPTGERWREPPPGPLGPPELARLLYEHNPLATSTALVRAASLRAAGGFDAAAPGVAEDLDLWLRLARGGATFVFEPRARVDYRRHPDGASADVAALAEGRLRVHERHADLVDEATRRRVRAADLVALARGRVRQRRYADARAALAEAAALAPPGPRERALAAILAIPGLRGALGRRDPYPGR